MKQRLQRDGRAIGALAALGLAMAAGLAAGAWLARARRQACGNGKVPEPRRSVAIDRYLGRWYELARYENRFERGCEGVSAEYGWRADGKISVRNIGHRDSPAGRAKIANGKARLVADSGNAKLKLSFGGPFYVGNYWILDHADDYSWSIVGEPSGRYLWILARDPHADAAHREDLYQRAAALGYDIGRLRPTRQ